MHTRDLPAAAPGIGRRQLADLALCRDAAVLCKRPPGLVPLRTASFYKSEIKSMDVEARLISNTFVHRFCSDWSMQVGSAVLVAVRLQRAATPNWL